jgi:acyl-CoA hydrolase/GNAT superfamily N-acetyltransferase
MGFTSWQERYKHKLTSAQEALKQVRSGSRVFVGSACGEPTLLLTALRERGEELADTEIINILTMGVAPYVEPELASNLRYSSLFLSGTTRQAVSEGRADYTPVFLSDVPALFKSGQIPIDTALIEISPPDEHGFCSYGISVDITKSATESAKIVIAEVNANMPRVLGDSFINVENIDILVESNLPILEPKAPATDETVSRVGEYVAELIGDGATIQCGIGTVSEALLPCIKDRRDLGVHTELFSEGLIDLIEAGVVTGNRKTLHRGKVVASFCMGTRRLYDFVDNNPLFEFHPSEYTNDPFIISQNDNMISINAALEVDLTGQVCADSLGYTFYSGIGGHADFIRGAARSKGGKPIIVLPSTTRDGSKSRIVPHLSTGAGVVTTRGDVHYVVTEYGIAYLHGKSIRDRAMALINIAHPKFREELLAVAKERHYVYADQALPPRGTQYPKELVCHKTFEGGLDVLFRPIKPADERVLQEFFYSLSDKSIYKRFFSPKRYFPHKEAQPWVNIDYSRWMVIAGLIGDKERGEKVIALAHYKRGGESENKAYITLAVAESYQNRGIGTSLLQYLAQVARERGVAVFTASVLYENKTVLSVIRKIGREIETTPRGLYYSVSIKL